MFLHLTNELVWFLLIKADNEKSSILNLHFIKKTEPYTYTYFIRNMSLYRHVSNKISIYCDGQEMQLCISAEFSDKDSTLSKFTTRRQLSPSAYSIIFGVVYDICQIIFTPSSIKLSLSKVNTSLGFSYYSGTSFSEF